MADHRDWTLDDFCAQCAWFASDFMVNRQRLLSFVIMRPDIECTLCRLFYLASHYPSEMYSNDASTIKLQVTGLYFPDKKRDDGSMKELPGVLEVARCLKVSGSSVSSNGSGRGFLLPLSPQGDMEWPGTRLARDPMYRGAGDQWHLPFHSPQTDSIDMKILYGWITGCRTKHVKRCPEPSPDSLISIRSLPGFKLVDCATRCVVQPPEVCEYAALSYVWGPPLAQGIDDLVSSSPATANLTKTLPKTIEDSIIVTLKMGLRYLWVDKYCINQGAHASELQSQLAAMDVIYHSATFTIIAAAGEDANFGLPGVGDRPRKARPHVTINGTTWVSGPKDTCGPIKFSTWATRGWTYQENHFARRRLIFTDEQVIFECNTCRRNESMFFAMSEEEDHSSDIFGVLSDLPRSDMTLSHHIQNYSLTALTYQSDVLKALHGLLASFSRGSNPVRQLWGIPTVNTAFPSYSIQSIPDDLDIKQGFKRVFGFGLTWATSTYNTVKRRAGFPSWSWSGWISPVEWPMLVDFGRETPKEFALVNRNGSTSPLTDDVTDQVFAGSSDAVSPYTYLLNIKAEILQVTFVDLKTFENGLGHPLSGEYLERYAAMYAGTSEDDEDWELYWYLDLTPNIEEDDVLCTALCTEVFKCIVLSSMHGIVVYERGGVMERIGRIHLNAAHDWHGQQPHIRDFFPGSIGEIVLG